MYSVLNPKSGECHNMIIQLWSTRSGLYRNRVCMQLYFCRAAIVLRSIRKQYSVSCYVDVSYSRNIMLSHLHILIFSRFLELPEAHNCHCAAEQHIATFLQKACGFEAEKQKVIHLVSLIFGPESVPVSGEEVDDLNNFRAAFTEFAPFGASSFHTSSMF